MGKPNFSEDFKRDAVHQITVRWYAVREVSERLGVSTYLHYIYGCLSLCKIFADLLRRQVPGCKHLSGVTGMVRPNGNSAWCVSTNGRPQEANIEARFLTYRSLPAGSFL